jgi:hypothetical protein
MDLDGHKSGKSNPPSPWSTERSLLCFAEKKNKIVIYTLQKNFFLHRFLFPVLSANLVVAYFFTFGASIELSAL